MSITFKSRAQMKAMGWLFDDVRDCSKCGAPVQWARSPRGKNCSFEINDPPQFHSQNCPGSHSGSANSFPPWPDDRNSGSRSALAAPAPAPAPEPNMIHMEALTLAVKDNTTVLKELVQELRQRRTSTAGPRS